MPQAVPPSRRSTAAGIGFMLVSVALFAVMSVFIKQVSDHIPVPEIVFFRNSVGLIPVLIAVAWAGGMERLRTERLAAHFGRSVVGVSAMAMLFWSYSLLPLADATALNYTAPLFLTALSAPLLGEKVGVYRWSAVLVGFVGMLVMLRPGQGMLELGALVGVGAAFLQALAMVAVSQLSRTEPSTTIVFYFTIFSTMLSAIPLYFIWMWPETWLDWVMLTGVGLSGGVAQLCLTRAYGHAQAVVIAPYTYTSLLWAGCFGYILWGHVPDNLTLLGAAIVAASGVFIMYREAHRKATAQRGAAVEP